MRQGFTTDITDFTDILHGEVSTKIGLTTNYTNLTNRLAPQNEYG